MIIVKPVGGLANQMGIYATGRALAEHCQSELKLDLSGLTIDPLRKYELDKLNIRADIATEEEIRRASGESRHRFVNRLAKSIGKRTGKSWHRIYRETSLAYDPGFFSLQPPIYVVGNFPSIHYYRDVFPQLRDELTISQSLSAASEEWLSKIKSTNSVAVHIRRGDYVNNPKTAAYHGVLGLDYYRSALERMKTLLSSPEFFVFSDDPVWVRDNIKSSAALHYVDCNDAENGYQDYWLMRHCKHHIIANSGFSRWAALLGASPGQVVMRPRYWTVETLLRDEDIGPDSWILIDNQF